MDFTRMVVGLLRHRMKMATAIPTRLIQPRPFNITGKCKMPNSTTKRPTRSSLVPRMRTGTIIPSQGIMKTGARTTTSILATVIVIARVALVQELLLLIFLCNNNCGPL